MRHLPLTFTLGIAVAAAFSACVFPDIIYLDEDDTTGGSAGSPVTTVGGGGTTGGMGGAGGMVTTTTTTTGGGGSGGMLPECSPTTLGMTGLCPGNQKCTVTDATTGAVGCALEGPTANWEVCGSDADCADGSWCDLEGNVCKPFCQNVADCSAFDGQCLSATQANGDPIPNVRTCISMCNPLTAAPCGQNSVTCAFIFNNQFDCQQSQNLNLGASCTEQADCGRTLACISSIGASCEQYCAPIGGSHANCTFDCLSIGNPAVTYMGMEVGTCF